jgi:putative ABC transport system ATP-binding protein
MAGLVVLDKVSKTYDGSMQEALTAISIAIAPGEFTAIMGPSGSGKSTVLNLIAGLDRPSQGHIHIGGTEIGRLSEAALARYRRDHLGFIFQFFNLLNNLTVQDNILIPAQLAGIKSRDANQRARELIDRLGLTEQAGKFPATLSGGQRQRVAIARALINRPRLLLADEPTGALDSRNGDEVMEILADLNDSGQTIVLVTHDAKLATRHAGRIITLRDGRILDDNRLEERPSPTVDLLRISARGAAR